MARKTSKKRSPSWTDARLQRRLSYWQKVLGLQDWDISAVFTDSGGLEGDNEAESKVFLESACATIKILRPSDFRAVYPGSARAQDVEVCLVHELLHVPTDPFWPKEATKVKLAEQHIDKTAIALVNLDRKASR